MQSFLGIKQLHNHSLLPRLGHPNSATSQVKARQAMLHFCSIALFQGTV